MFYLLISSMSLSLCFGLFYITHPLSLALSLIIYAALLSLITFKINCSWWFYLLILIFLGGVMILVIYMTTLAANEKFNLILNPLNLVILPALTLISPLFLQTSPFNPSLSPRLDSLFTLYETMNIFLFILCLLYLLLTLFSVVKIVKLDKGPLSARL